MTTPVPLQFTPELPYEMPFTVIGENLQKERKYTCSMYASSEFDMEPLLVDQKTELWQEQCMNQEPIYKHLQSLEARSCNTLRKGIHAPAPATQKGYTNQEISKHYGVPMNHVRAWQSKARKYTAGYQIIYSFILKENDYADTLYCSRNPTIPGFHKGT